MTLISPFKKVNPQPFKAPLLRVLFSQTSPQSMVENGELDAQNIRIDDA
ncbi:MAG: hypothetical protein VX154_03920 [Pseudomonadota bacterium]|nr:hypothetical protein [Pseudomonadota bacterium]